jgi:hypothetical protein
MHGVKEGLHGYPRQTGHHTKLLLAFESCRVMEVILQELFEAAARFRFSFHFLFFVLLVAHKGDERLVKK